MTRGTRGRGASSVVFLGWVAACVMSVVFRILSGGFSALPFHNSVCARPQNVGLPLCAPRAVSTATKYLMICGLMMIGFVVAVAVAFGGQARQRVHPWHRPLRPHRGLDGDWLCWSHWAARAHCFSLGTALTLGWTLQVMCSLYVAIRGSVATGVRTRGVVANLPHVGHLLYPPSGCRRSR